jgi:murein DD-endopeptidase MepM/ murein hydrolase activator NlpD
MAEIRIPFRYRPSTDRSSTRTRGLSALGWVGGLTLMATLIAPSASAVLSSRSQDPTGFIEKQQEEIRRQKADLDAQIDLATASNEEVAAALTKIDADLADQQTKLDDASHEVDDAERAATDLRSELANVDTQVDRLTESLKTSAISRYMKPEGKVDEAEILRAGTLDEAEKRRAMADAVRDRSSDIVDELRNTKAHSDELKQRATDATATAEKSRNDQQILLNLLQVAKGERTQIKAAWDARLDGLHQQEGDLSAADAQATEIIRQQQAKGPAAQGKLIWPIQGQVSQEFHSGHEGMDIFNTINTPIYAAQAGKVISAGFNNGGYGNFTIIDHGGQFSTAYAHQNSIAVKVGDVVAQGQLIGYEGTTGHSTGPHLHFETRVNGVAKNPRIYLP